MKLAADGDAMLPPVSSDRANGKTPADAPEPDPQLDPDPPPFKYGDRQTPHPCTEPDAKAPNEVFALHAVTKAQEGREVVKCVREFALQPDQHGKDGNVCRREAAAHEKVAAVNQCSCSGTMDGDEGSGELVVSRSMTSKQ